MGNESIFIPSKGNRYFIIFPLHFSSFARRFFLSFYQISFKLSEICKERSAYCHRYELIFVRTSTLNPKGHRPCTVSKGNRSARTRSDNHANWIALVVAAGIKRLIILGMNYSVYKSVSCLAGSKVATSSTRHQSRPFEIWCRRTYPKYRITYSLWWIMQKRSISMPYFVQSKWKTFDSFGVLKNYFQS